MMESTPTEFSPDYTDVERIFTAGDVAEAVGGMLEEHSPGYVRECLVASARINEIGAEENAHDQDLVEAYRDHARQCREQAAILSQ